MKVFQLTALALASMLALSGCGDDNNSTANNGTNTPEVPTKPPVDNGLSEIEQAKEMIRTAKLFVSDNKAVTDAYKGASDVLNESQSTRLNYTLHIPGDLQYYMKKQNLSQLTAADIVALTNDPAFEISLGNIELTPASDFVATLNADGQFTLTGTTKVDVQEYNPTTKTYDKTTATVDTFTTVFDGYEDALMSNTSSANFNGSIGFNRINIGSGADAVMLTSTTKGAIVQGEFSGNVIVNDDFDMDDINNAGIILEKAVVKLGSVKLAANDSVIEAKDFEFASMDISRPLAGGAVEVRTIPYKLALTGKMTKENPSTDIEITLNATANDTDIKKFIIVNDSDNLEEVANDYVGMAIVLAIKGVVTKEGSTTIPLDFQANLKRTSRNIIELQGLTASVEGKKLFVKGQSTLDTDYDVTGTMLTIEQNNALVELSIDENGDFAKDSMGKLSDIMVNGKDYGDLIDNNGQITAKFTDDSLIIL